MQSIVLDWFLCYHAFDFIIMAIVFDLNTKCVKAYSTPHVRRAYLTCVGILFSFVHSHFKASYANQENVKYFSSWSTQFHINILQLRSIYMCLLYPLATARSLIWNKNQTISFVIYIWLIVQSVRGGFVHTFLCA